MRIAAPVRARVHRRRTRRNARLFIVLSDLRLSVRSMNRRLAEISGLATAVLFLAACGSNDSSSPASTATSSKRTFVDQVDNPWFPLTPGTTLVYRGVKDGQRSRERMTVTGRTKVINGVRCTVVRDLLFQSGHLGERTTDWYAQDSDGNVWYFGEDTAELDPSGQVTSTEGSWQAGVDGAREGIFMPAQPKVGQSFAQEHYSGHAEDHFQVLSLSARVTVPYTSSSEALLTKEWTPLEPGVIDHKYYVRGIGTVKEQTVKGGDERNLLVDFRR
jgi:hypothetical protein